MDTEEEQGSPNLPAAIRANNDLFAADMLLIFDGPPHASNRPTVSFGARGIARVTLTTYGPIVAQHSGHYGNFLPNPVQRLAGLLASMKSPDGRVTIEGFYDGIEIDDETRAQQRYTLSHLAHDVKKQTGVTEPLRDWFPISAAGPISDMTDLFKGADADWGTMKCGCHPN